MHDYLVTVLHQVTLQFFLTLLAAVLNYLSLSLQELVGEGDLKLIVDLERDNQGLRQVEGELGKSPFYFQK